jgi:ER-bound oxygenase mpaB/B'/Rubber oxygenase, catalytic domain
MHPGMPQSSYYDCVMHRALQEINQLDPVGDHQRIVYLISTHEFPFDTTRALEFALFRTYAVPSIGRLLEHTGEFTGRTQKRYDDTDLILSEIVENGYDSERAKSAFRRMNGMHGHYSIPNDDFRYVLSTFIFEQVRWNARFGWRPMTDREKQALYYFWREVGRRMAIRDIPGSYEEFEQYNLDYERTRFGFTEGGQRVAGATRDLFIGWFLPRALYPLARPFVHALLDDPLREAFRFPKAPGLVSGLMRLSLGARAVALRLFPERRQPKLRTKLKNPTYPKGYQIEDLGTLR